tara:strand:+ start:2085 stop:2561 length:477 start_codon:yes stop_codon:yes gene_type:complete
VALYFGDNYMLLELLLLAGLSGPDYVDQTEVGDVTDDYQWTGSFVASYFLDQDANQELFVYTFSNDATSDIAIFDLVIDDTITWEVEVNPGETVSYSYVTDEAYGWEFQQAVLFNAEEGSYDFFTTIGTQFDGNLIPSPGAIAMLGVVGLGRRRNRKE